jgi:hypothetical protein
MPDDSNNTTDVSEIVEKILGDIQNLQAMENELFTKINTDTTLTPIQQQEIIDQINKISTMRSNLYTTLSEVNSFYQNALTSSTGTLIQQTAAINIVETELNRSKKRLEELQAQKNNKIRLVEINQYYGDKYSEHSTLMKIIIFTLIPIIILTILYNNGLLPSTLYYILFIIVGFVGAIYGWSTYSSMISRDNMRYDEYNWPFNIDGAPKGTGSDKDPWLSSPDIGTCVGEYCCSPGQQYDSKLDKCISPYTQCPAAPPATPPAAPPATPPAAPPSAPPAAGGGREQFQLLQPATFTNEDEINDILTKRQPGKYKSDFNLSELKPYNS